MICTHDVSRLALAAALMSCLSMGCMSGGSDAPPPLPLTAADRTADPACTASWLAGVRGRAQLLGPFATRAATVDPESFSDEMRGQMQAALVRIRSETGGAESQGDHVRSAR